MTRTLRATATVLALGSAMLAASGASAASRTFTVTDFDSVRLEAPFDIALQTGRGVSARAEGEADLLDRVDLSVSARVLTIRLKASPFQSDRNANAGAIRLVLTVSSVRRIQLSGAGSIRATGLDRARAELISTGSGSLVIDGIDSDKLSVLQLGSGAVQLAGKAKSVELRVSGSGSLDAKALTAADLDLTLEGPAMVTAHADRAAKIVATGAGSVIVEGRGACTVNHAGSGLVRCGRAGS